MKRRSDEKKSRVSWSTTEDDGLLKAVLEDKQNREAEGDAEDEEDWDEIAKNIPDKTPPGAPIMAPKWGLSPDPSVQEVGLRSSSTPHIASYEPTVIPLLQKTCRKSHASHFHCRRSTSDLRQGPGRFGRAVAFGDARLQCWGVWGWSGCQVGREGRHNASNSRHNCLSFAPLSPPPLSLSLSLSLLLSLWAMRVFPKAVSIHARVKSDLPTAASYPQHTDRNRAQDKPVLDLIAFIVFPPRIRSSVVLIGGHPDTDDTSPVPPLAFPFGDVTRPPCPAFALWPCCDRAVTLAVTLAVTVL